MKREEITRIEIESHIILWAKDKDLLQYENRFKQGLKLVSEVGELSDALIKDYTEEITDAIGDIEVVLTILKTQLGLPHDVPINLAYNVIKNRTGVTENGTFIKD